MAMRIVTDVRQYLAAGFLIVIGLMASGCGDTASVNPAAELASLTVTTGTTTATLQPPFNPGTTNYTVNLSNNITSVTVSAQPAVSGDTVSIDNQTTTSKVIDLGQPVPTGSTTSVSIAVSSSGATPRTYTVSLVRAGLTGNNSLQSLAVSSGSLTPSFDADTQDYTVDVANNVGTLSVTPILDDPNATMTINGKPAISGQPSTITLGGPGSDTHIDIAVTAQNNTRKTYTILVNRGGLPSNNNLRNLAVSQGSLNPSFNANLQAYTVDVPNTVGSIAVTPTLSDTAATMTVNGQATNSGQTRTVTLNPAGQDTAIAIVVTAQNSSTKRYTVTVSRGVSSNNNLQSLITSPGTLNPTFSTNRTSYTVNVVSTVTSLTVTPRLQDATASMTVNGQATNSGQARPHPLGAPGSNPPPIFIVVTAQNGTQKTYTVGVNRAALGGNNNLSALTVSPGTLDSAFSANDLNYTVNVGSNVTSVNVSATKADPNAVMSEDVTAGAGTATGQATIQLGGQGTTTVVLITVTAPNNSSKTYRITVNRAAPSSNNNLSALSVTPGTLAPRFAAGTLDYRVNVATDIGNATVSATKSNQDAVMAIGSVTVPAGTRTGQASVTLGGQDSDTPVSIIVTAPSGVPQEYRITIHRAAPASNNNLSALSVTPGSLSPAFAADTLGYTVNVASDVTSVAISATKADSNAVISGDVPNSGQANITLSGATTPVSIIVTAPSGASKTYSIDVTRAAPAAPPAPTSAPDLIPQDDSCIRVANECFPPTSEEDNITNVNTPRFRVPSPGDGETPNLYVDGVKVDSTFNQGANTLKPTSALSDGDHTITSTVTNAGGESPQSPSLTVTIDTVAPGP